MVFTPGPWLPPLPAIPDVSLPEFMFDERYGRAPFATSLDPYVCNTSGKAITALGQKQRIEDLARALAFELGWAVNEGSEFDKVIDVPTVHWAVHRLNGIVAPVNSTYTVYELTTLLKRSKAKALFTTLGLLETAQAAAKLSGIPPAKVFLLNMPGDDSIPQGVTTTDQLLQRSQPLPPLESIKWTPGQSVRQIAYLSHSSGTSGPPKMAMVSHHNIIANLVQINLFDLKGRGGPDTRWKVLGLLPSSHVYGVVQISHISTYRGDSVIVIPKFDMRTMLEAVQKWGITYFPVVPPIIVALGKSSELLDQYKLGTIQQVMSGGAPLDAETLQRLNFRYPHWIFRQGYGLTEAGAAISLTSGHDPWEGSAGNIIPGVQVKLLREDGSEVTGHDQPGEVFAKGPGVIPGYWDDPIANAETFVEDSDGRWLRTGDIAVIRKAPSGLEHVFIVDRIKEVIKVKGFQVVPAELEALLLTHPAVAECAVIGVPDERAGEVPKAYVQRSTISANLSEKDLVQELNQLVQSQKARQKWLTGGIKFVDEIPKSASGKTLRRLIRDQEKESQKKHRAWKL